MGLFETVSIIILPIRNCNGTGVGIGLGVGSFIDYL